MGMGKVNSTYHLTVDDALKAAIYLVRQEHASEPPYKKCKAALNLLQMTRQKLGRMAGWFFFSLGVWGIFSAILQPWLIDAVGEGILLKRELVALTSLPEFRYFQVLMSGLFIASSFGLLKCKAWAETLALSSLLLSAVLGSALWIRYFGMVGGLEPVALLVWVSGLMVCITLSTLLIRNQGAASSSNFQRLWTGYAVVHWKVVTFLVRVFGIGAVIVGSVMLISGIKLLLTPDSTVAVDGVATSESMPKVMLVVFSCVFIICGVLCLIAKPLSNKKG